MFTTFFFPLITVAMAVERLLRSLHSGYTQHVNEERDTHTHDGSGKREGERRREGGREGRERE